MSWSSELCGRVSTVSRSGQERRTSRPFRYHVDELSGTLRTFKLRSMSADPTTRNAGTRMGTYKTKMMCLHGTFPFKQSGQLHCGKAPIETV